MGTSLTNSYKAIANESLA